MKNDNGDYCYIDERGEIVVFDVELSTVNLIANGFKIPTNEYIAANQKFILESMDIINNRIEKGKEIAVIGEVAFFKKYLIAEG